MGCVQSEKREGQKSNYKTVTATVPSPIKPNASQEKE